MPDSRFFEDLTPVTLAELATITGARLARSHLGDRVVRAVAGLAGATIDEVAFYADHRFAADLAATGAGACFMRPGDEQSAPPGCAVLLCHAPQVAFAACADRLHRARRHLAADGAIHPTARLEDGVVLGPGVVIGPGAAVGGHTYIAAGAVIGPGVAIGRNGYVGAGARIGFALIGDGVRIHAGAVIGEPGFGAALGARGIIDIPQLGRVIIQDGVTLGSGACVDRGALGDTVIGENTKIDNLVQIAHNVVIGRNCLLAAHTGISGSVTIGDNCQFGGRAGVADHIDIGPGARVAAAAGVMEDIPAGQSWGGYPARPVRRWLREVAVLGRLALGRPRGDKAT